MPEALAVLFVMVAVAIIFVVAKLQANDPAKRDAAAELQQLRHQHAWLDEQLQRATQENWDHQMIALLTSQLAAATEELAKAAPSGHANPAAMQKAQTSA